jgi:AraC family transcriptional activator of pobA
MAKGTPIRIKTIAQLHRFQELPMPQHPLISIVDYALIKDVPGVSAVFDFYSISLKRGVNKLYYGQQEYDFDEGVMYFLSPNQVLSAEGNIDLERSGWILFVHPDFLWNSKLGKSIKQYEFFNYSVKEALFLSEKEELTGQTTHQHIQNKLIEMAKEKLSTTSLSVSEIAYQLGFEHSQSFNKLFKSKTELSPLEFRRSIN